MPILKISKKLILVTSFILLLIASVVGFIWYKYYSFPQSDAFGAVPTNSAFIVDIKEPDQFFTKIEDKAYQSEISNLNFIKKASRQWKLLYEELPEAITLSISKLTLAAQIGKENTLDFIHILDGCSEDLPLEEYLTVANHPFEKRVFSQQEYFVISLSDTISVSIALSNNLLIFAETPYLLESALAQIQTSFRSVLRDKSFQKIRGLVGKNADATILFNMKKVPLFSSFFTKKKTLQNVQFLQFFADWVGIDIGFQEKTISLDGYLSSTDKNQLLKSLKKQELPDKTLIASILPDNTASMIYIGFKKAKNFFKNIEVADKKAFEQYFLPWMSGELAYLVTEPTNRHEYTDHQFAIFKTKDVAQTTKKLEEFGQTFGKLNKEDYFNYTIHHILAKDIIKPIFGNGINTIHNPYYVILDDYVVFCNSTEAIKELLDKYTYGQTLGQDINYLQFVENLSTTSNMYLYINTSNVLDIMRAFVKDEFETTLENEFEYYQKLTPLGLQLTPYKDLFVLNGQIKYNAKGKQATSVLWKADLQSAAAIAPTFVKNHNTGELEILVQDVDNRLYLINRNGEILWTQQIERRIISDIYQIDYYKNTFLQYVFNTDSKIYVIDRNGEPVDKFPVTVSEGITNGMLVVDYDKSRDYRYFLATSDGNIYGFQKDGTFLEGWSPKPNVGNIRFPIQHFVKENKDYITALNDTGEMFFFQRNGEVRMDSVHFREEVNSTFGVDLSEPQRIVVTNQRGKAFILNFDRKIFKLGMNVDENKNMQFLFSDVLNNHRKDYVVLGKRELGVFSYTDDNDFKGFGKYQFNQEQSKLFEVNMPNTDKYRIGTLSERGKSVYLFNGKAQLFPDFPLSGTTAFQIEDLYNDGVNVLVVGDGSSVFAYKLKNIVF